MKTPVVATARAGSWTLFTLLVAAGWLLVGTLEVAWNGVVARLGGPAVIWTKALVNLAGFWGLQAALAPLLIWLLRRAPFERGKLRRAVVGALLTLLAYTVAFNLLRFAVLSATFWRSSQMDAAVRARVFVQAVSNFTILLTPMFTWLITAGAVNGWDYYLRYRERARAAAALELERANLRASLSEARLEALQAQLQPHFLFNSLHAISTLILKGDMRAANEMVSLLGQFLRMTLDNGETPTVPLAVELEFLDAYLSIQRVRFGDRLHVSVEIDDCARALAVPSLILQPLVENSIRHGIASDAGQGRVTVRACVADGTLTLEVEDDGLGPPAGQTAAEGIGLGNIRQRLEQLYPNAHSLALGTGSAGGALTRITIPARAASSDEETAGHGR